jgi:nitroreductase
MDTTTSSGVLAAVMRSRRTCKAYTGQAVARRELEAALELARWAPTHQLREPWRFAVLEQPGIQRLIAFLRIDPAFAAQRGADERARTKFEQLLARLPQAGALIFVTWMRQEAPAIDAEDHAATAAAVQNLLLALHDLGLGTYWSTSAPFMHAATARWFEIDPEREGVMGVIWVGHAATIPPPPPRRPLDERVRFLG